MTKDEKEKKITAHVIGCGKCRAHVLRLGIGNIRRGEVPPADVKKGACAAGARLVDELCGAGVR
jgi:hypothetical protein